MRELSLGNAEERGLFAVSAIDEKPLKDSEKLLIIFASDARNTDMRFRDKAEKIIEDWGRLPVTLLRNRVDVTLAGNTVSWTLSPVGLDGKIHDKIAVGSLARRVRCNGSRNSRTNWSLRR